MRQDLNNPNGTQDKVLAFIDLWKGRKTANLQEALVQKSVGKNVYA